MGLVKKGKDLWFFEDLYSDTTYGFKVSKVVVPEADTGFQKLMILETDLPEASGIVKAFTGSADKKD